jgi:hypothetical protein
MNRNNVTVTRKERRRDRRRSMEIEAALDGQPVRLADLSASGFGVAIDATDKTFPHFRVGMRTYLELKADGVEALKLVVEIVREMGENGVVGGAFVKLSDKDYNVIESLLTGRYRRRR